MKQLKGRNKKLSHVSMPRVVDFGRQTARKEKLFVLENVSDRFLATCSGGFLNGPRETEGFKTGRQARDFGKGPSRELSLPIAKVNISSIESLPVEDLYADKSFAGR